MQLCTIKRFYVLICKWSEDNAIFQYSSFSGLVYQTAPHKIYVNIWKGFIGNNFGIIATFDTCKKCISLQLPKTKLITRVIILIHRNIVYIPLGNIHKDAEPFYLSYLSFHNLFICIYLSSIYFYNSNNSYICKWIPNYPRYYFHVQWINKYTVQIPVPEPRFWKTSWTIVI